MTIPRTIGAAGLIAICVLGACGKKDDAVKGNGARGDAGAMVARTHRLDEFRISGSLTEEEVAAQLGAPARVVGSGVTWYVYELDDGRELWLRFGQGMNVPHILMDADLYERRGEAMEKVQRIFGD